MLAAARAAWFGRPQGTDDRETNPGESHELEITCFAARARLAKRELPLDGVVDIGARSWLRPVRLVPMTAAAVAGAGVTGAAGGGSGGAAGSRATGGAGGAAGRGGTAGAAGSIASGISAGCQSCAATMCSTQFVACAGASACQMCVTNNYQPCLSDQNAMYLAICNCAKPVCASCATYCP